MVKIDYAEPAELQEDFDSAPDRKQGRWQELVKKVKKTGVAANVTGITRGQAWSLKRTATKAGLDVRVLEHGERVIVMPPK